VRYASAAAVKPRGTIFTIGITACDRLICGATKATQQQWGEPARVTHTHSSLARSSVAVPHSAVSRVCVNELPTTSPV
jgi:hypothetical protein